MSASWRRAYDAQMGLWRWLQSPTARELRRAHYEQNVAGLTGVQELLANLYASEEPRLLGADPIFVAADMCELVEAAANPHLDQPFKPEPLYATDIPTSCGFLYFDRPFAVLDRFDEPLSIRAVSWTPMVSVGDDEADLAGSITPTDPDAVMRRWSEREGDGFAGGDGLAIAIYSDSFAQADDYYRSIQLMPPPIELSHVTPWYFGMGFEGNEVDEHGKATGAAWWWRVTQITFRLMQQQLAAKERLRGDRHQRREAARLQLPERETLVVRLRRAKGKQTEDEHGPANYSHRFIVSGHWRNQWYSASSEHRQIWISPYVKGDEALPLVVKPRRAMVWTR